MPVRLFAGASGFSYKPWKGPFYPEGLPDAEMLGYYAARLPAVEINNTFYRLPKAKMLEDWAAQTPDGFRFVLKASRRITHMQRLKDVGELLGYLFETAGVLGPKLGPLLFQLPPHLKKDLDRLRTFLELVPADRRVALEFRNASWFEDDVFEALRAHDAALCVAETEPERPGGRRRARAARRDRVVGLPPPAPRELQRCRSRGLGRPHAWPGLVGGLCVLQARGRRHRTQAGLTSHGTERAYYGPDHMQAVG